MSIVFHVLWFVRYCFFPSSLPLLGVQNGINPWFLSITALLWRKKDISVSEFFMLIRVP